MECFSEELLSGTHSDEDQSSEDFIKEVMTDGRVEL